MVSPFVFKERITNQETKSVPPRANKNSMKKCKCKKKSLWKLKIHSRKKFLLPTFHSLKQHKITKNHKIKNLYLKMLYEVTS